MSKLTLIGFYNYDNTLFDNLMLPDGIESEVVINNILIRGGEFESLYSDLDFIKNAVHVWSNKWHRTFTKWHSALSVEYNPLNNYDRTEEWETTDDGTNTVTNKNKLTGNSENKVSAYNSDLYEPDSNTISTSETESDGLTSNKNINIRKGRTYGNIGVTTSQQMLQAELDLQEWNLIEHITDIFLQEFTIPVYM